MRNLLIIISILIIATTQSLAQSNDELLNQLDQLMLHTDDYVMQKERRIQTLKNLLPKSSSPEDQYLVYRKILDEYSVFDSDSALTYGKKALVTATEIGSPELINDAQILNSYTLAATGLLDQSREALDAVDEKYLDDISRPKYLSQRVYQLTHEDQYKTVASDRLTNLAEVQTILDSIVADVNPDHPEYYFYVAYQALSDGSSTEKAINIIEPSMKDRKYDSRDDAKIAWALSRLYMLAGDNENRQKYLTLSAIADLKTANRDVASFEELSTMMQEKGDLEHAYHYISHALDCAELLKNRVRVLNVAMLQSEISDLYQEKVYSLQRQAWIYLVILGILLIIVVNALIFIYIQRRRLDKTNAQLLKVNDELKGKLNELSGTYSELAHKNAELLEISQELRDSNQRLAESDYIKVKCMGAIFTICSEYINKLDDFRRVISRNLKTNQYDKIKSLTDSTVVKQSELKEFYDYFDSLFLSVYPNFIEDFNNLLPEDSKIEIKEGNKLNTELRIYALIRMGITDSVKIASVLHCSPQTIYNKRFKVRNLIGLPKEELLRIVQSLSSYSNV